MPKPSVPPLSSDRVRLRLLDEADLASTLAWRNQPDVRRWFVHSDVIAPEQHQSWYAGYRQRDDDLVFIVEETRGPAPVPVGQISLYHIDLRERRAEFGRMMIGEQTGRGRGLATLATECLLSYAFNQLGMREVYLEVREDNAAAIALYNRTGFRETGRKGGMVIMQADPPGAAQ